MEIEFSQQLEAAVKIQANRRGLPPAIYLRELIERDLASSGDAINPNRPFKTGRGMLKKYGQAPTEEEIDANRAEMFGTFGEDF